MTLYNENRHIYSPHWLQKSGLIIDQGRALNLEGGFEFLKYAINIEKASMIYLSPVQKEHAKRKWLDLESGLCG
jgi:hypothetical protein